MTTDLIELELNFLFETQKNNFLDEFIVSSNQLFIFDEIFWQNDLKMWINAIRQDLSFQCHKVVRGATSFSMGLKFTDDATISQLNSLWLGKKGKTDVLSFPVIDAAIKLPLDQSIELGDIIVSLQTAKSQAKEHEHDLTVELRWLVSHGLLHLLGWEHITQIQLQEMLTCQKYLLNMNLNFPPIFGNPPDFS